MANYLGITRDPLDVGTINGMVCHESCGAVALFVGTTRDTFEGKEVRSLEYEAYESMAKKELESLCIDLRAHWPDIVNIAIYHRLGLVGPKEASVVIAIATPHRQASLEAVSYAIEQLKRNVPIWKKELYGDGNAEWKQNKEAFCFSKSKINSEIPIPKELVQIAAEKSEVKNRIACFLSKKREEIDQNNIMDYSDPNNIDSLEDSCARVNSVLVKQENSKCHLKVCRVKNTEGPQTRPNYLGTIDKLMTNEPSETTVNVKKEPQKEKNNDLGTVEQKRIETIEQHLFQSTKSHLPVNMRLKDIEDRLLRLESISPEYWHFMVDTNSSAKNCSDNGATSYNQVHVKHESDSKVVNHKAHTYTVNEINNLIQEIENCNNKESSN